MAWQEEERSVALRGDGARHAEVGVVHGEGFTDSFKPFGGDASFGKTVCHQCHTRVKTNDFFFTNYARR